MIDTIKKMRMMTLQECAMISQEWTTKTKILIKIITAATISMTKMFMKKTDTIMIPMTRKMLMSKTMDKKEMIMINKTITDITM